MERDLERVGTQRGLRSATRAHSARRLSRLTRVSSVGRPSVLNTLAARPRSPYRPSNSALLGRPTPSRGSEDSESESELQSTGTVKNSATIVPSAQISSLNGSYVSTPNNSSGARYALSA